MRTKSAGLMPSGIVAFRMPNAEILRRVAILLTLQSRIPIMGTWPLPSSAVLPLSSALQGLIGDRIVGLISPAINAAHARVAQALRR